MKQCRKCSFMCKYKKRSDRQLTRQTLLVVLLLNNSRCIPQKFQIPKSLQSYCFAVNSSALGRTGIHLWLVWVCSRCVKQFLPGIVAVGALGQAEGVYHLMEVDQTGFMKGRKREKKQRSEWELVVLCVMLDSPFSLKAVKSLTHTWALKAQRDEALLSSSVPPHNTYLHLHPYFRGMCVFCKTTSACQCLHCLDSSGRKGKAKDEVTVFNLKQGFIPCSLKKKLCSKVLWWNTSKTKGGNGASEGEGVNCGGGLYRSRSECVCVTECTLIPTCGCGLMKEAAASNRSLSTKELFASLLKIFLEDLWHLEAD